MEPRRHVVPARLLVVQQHGDGCTAFDVGNGDSLQAGKRGLVGVVLDAENLGGPGAKRELKLDEEPVEGGPDTADSVGLKRAAR